MAETTPKLHPGIEEALQRSETTQLSPLEEALFKGWTQANGIKDADAPDAHYDMRGFYKATNGQVHPPGAVDHFPDTFKQHGHPTFSIESKYSAGPHDGGMWVPHPLAQFASHQTEDRFLGQPKMLPSHFQPQATPLERSETEKDPMRTLIDLMKQVNDSKAHENKATALAKPEPPR